jgi:hypothetical protein
MTYAAAHGWTRVDPYELVHPAGWRIASCIIQGKPRHILGHGGDTQGNFPGFDVAVAKHVELLGSGRWGRG